MIRTFTRAAKRGGGQACSRAAVRKICFPSLLTIQKSGLGPPERQNRKQRKRSLWKNRWNWRNPTWTSVCRVHRLSRWSNKYLNPPPRNQVSCGLTTVTYLLRKNCFQEPSFWSICRINQPIIRTRADFQFLTWQIWSIFTAAAIFHRIRECRETFLSWSSESAGTSSLTLCQSGL